MSLKRRGSDLDHGAKKMKSDDSNDGVSPGNTGETTPGTPTVVPHQPVTNLDHLPQTAREKINYLLQALADVSPETLYQVDIVEQINAVNSDGHWSPSFMYEPPPLDIIVGHHHGSHGAHDCKKTGCGKIVSRVRSLPYANGFFRFEVEHPQRHTCDGFALPYPAAEHAGSTFVEESLKDNFANKVQTVARKVVISHNREVLGWWVRRIAHFEPLLTGREEAMGQFLSGDIVCTEADGVDIWYFR
ncbi:hypothetical protein FBULB1_810 [Fusarium bulbicola]|nr:hypothetical protein FBULB1_810 [Fusarium bulbicola]